jgi:glycosyltransferase involved in cell wall biosynthesis
VIYLSSAGVRPFDSGFGQKVTWDVDLLSGYRSEFVNRAHLNEPYAPMTAVRDWDIVRRIWSGKYEALWVTGYYYITFQLAMLTQSVARRSLLFREEQTQLEPRPLWKQALKQTVLRLMLSKAFGLYIGTENRRWLHGLGIPEKRLFHVHYCADVDYLTKEAARLASHRRNLRSRWGLPADDIPVILTVGRLVEKKQPGFLLEAFRRARLRQRCVLMVVGSGPLRNALEAQVARDGISDVVFTGFVDQSRIAEAYAAADIFALASAHDETWGMAVSEAMPFALPLLLTDKVGSSADLVRHGENGYVVSSTDPADLANRIEELARSTELRVRMGVESARLAQSWNNRFAAQGAIRAVAAAVGGVRWSQADALVHRQ